VRTKSAAVPEEPLDEGVTVVVGSTFDDIVKNPKNDVLLEVYAPWCGHCKSLAPIYAKLAKRFKDIDSVVIAKMDGTENEVPGLEVQGYPTLLFFPAEKNAEGVKYEGARELKDLTKFIKKEAKIAYELPKKEDQKDEEEAAEETDAAAEDGDAEEGHDEL
jgi:protein disulfide-isomerase A1